MLVVCNSRAAPPPSPSSRRPEMRPHPALSYAALGAGLERRVDAGRAVGTRELDELRVGVDVDVWPGRT